MNYQIAQRICNLMDNDKICNPQSVCHILEEEFKPIVENYLSLSKDFKVRFKKDKNKNIFFLELEVNKIKPFGYIPQ